MANVCVRIVAIQASDRLQNVPAEKNSCIAELNIPIIDIDAADSQKNDLLSAKIRKILNTITLEELRSKTHCQKKWQMLHNGLPVSFLQETLITIGDIAEHDEATSKSGEIVPSFIIHARIHESSSTHSKQRQCSDGDYAASESSCQTKQVSFDSKLLPTSTRSPEPQTNAVPHKKLYDTLTTLSSMPKRTPLLNSSRITNFPYDSSTWHADDADFMLDSDPPNFADRNNAKSFDDHYLQSGLLDQAHTFRKSNEKLPLLRHQSDHTFETYGSHSNPCHVYERMIDGPQQNKSAQQFQFMDTQHLPCLITVIGARDEELSDDDLPNASKQVEFLREERSLRKKRHALAAEKRVQTYTTVEAFLNDRIDEKRCSPRTRLRHVGSESTATQFVSGSLTRSDKPLWISIEDASDAAVATIGQHFGLHSLTIEDCQSYGIREKLEVFPDYLFIVFHALDDTIEQFQGLETVVDIKSIMLPSAGFSQAVMSTTPLRLLIFGSCVLSFQKSRLKCVQNVRSLLEKIYHNRIENPAWLIHALIDAVVDSMLPVVASVCNDVDVLDHAIYEDSSHLAVRTSTEHKLMRRTMCNVGRRLGFLRQRLWSKRDILTSLLQKDWATFLPGLTLPYVRDVHDHVITMLHGLDAAMEINGNLESTYIAIVNIDVSNQAQETNDHIKRLSAVATIMLPLTLVAGIMGMNTAVPWQTGENYGLNDLLPFIGICMMMFICSVIMVTYLRRVDML